jgi:hypothetical protein
VQQAAESGIGWRSASGGGPVRYRDMEKIDLDAARRAVCAWLDEHKDGTLAQMADELKASLPGLSRRDGDRAARHDGRRAAPPDPAGYSWSDRWSPAVTLPQEPLRAINNGLSVRRDSVIRLHRFQGDHPDVQFTSPVMGRYGQYMALIPPSTIPGEPREIIV